MPCWIEAVLDFFDLESTVTIGIKFVESFVDKALSKGIQITAEGSQKFIETDLSISTFIKNGKETLSIASTHAWNTIVVKDSLELAETELT